MTHDQKDSADFDLGMNTTPGMWEMVSDELDGVSLPESVSKAIHALASGSAKIWPLMGYELKQRLRNVSKLRQLIGTEERNMSDKTTKHEELKSVDMLKALDDAQVMHVRINSSNEIVIGESCDNYFEQTATPEQVRLMARQLKEIADEVERKAAQLEPYQQRMLDEHAELSDRISKLEAFTGTEAFEQLPELERCLLNHQLIAMHNYAGILRHRIRLWSKSDD